jgi:hypothetical protein
LGHEGEEEKQEIWDTHLSAEAWTAPVAKAVGVAGRSGERISRAVY